MQLNQKIAVVSGGCSGLGKSVVEALSSKNVKVAIFDLNEKEGERLLNNMGRPKNLLYKSVDVTCEDSVNKAIQDVVSMWGGIHICVNCAGVAPAHKLIDREFTPIPLEEYAKVININLIGSFNVAKASAAMMCKNHPDDITEEKGVIINTASIAGFEGQVGQTAYAASKGGIIASSLPMARELARNGIRVNAIAPGVMGTPMLLSMPDTVQEALVSNIPFPKRLGYPSEFASLALHLIENSYINGETIRLDGALRMGPK